MKIIESYAQSLLRLKLSETTVKNYLSDARQFLLWKKSFSPLEDVSQDLVDKYLRTSSFTKSVHTTKRKTISLKKFVDWNLNSDKKLVTKNSKEKRSINKFAFFILLLVPYLIAALGNLPSQKLALESEYLKIDNRLPNKVSMQVPSSVIKTAKPIEVAVSGYEVSTIDDTQNQELLLSINQNSYQENSHIEIIYPTGGTESIETNNNSTAIFDEQITDDTIITVTPTTPTFDQQLYIEAQGDGYAIVSVEDNATEEIKFNWIAI